MAPPTKNDDEIDWPMIGRALMGLVLVAFVASLWINQHPEYGAWTKYVQPVPWVIGGLLLVIVVIQVARRRRRRQRDRMAAALVPHFGPDWDTRRQFSAFRYKKGVPQKIKADYPDHLPDGDPLWRAKVEKTVEQRMDAFKVRGRWDLQRGRVQIQAENVRGQVAQETLRQQTYAENRIGDIVGAHMRTQVTVTVDGWEWVEGSSLPSPEKFSVKYPAAATVTANMKRSLEIKMAYKLGGRWAAEVDGVNDVLTMYPKPDLPDFIRHPGTELYADAPLGMLYYAIDQDNTPRGWKIGQGSTMPHAVVVGATGGGKTTFIRSVLLGAVAQGIPVYACDPKRVELRPFQGFPGVGGIAASPTQMASMIDDVLNLMMTRYEIIEQRPELKSTFRPIVFIVDELLILVAMAQKMKKDKKGDAGDPMGGIQQLLALARTASVHLVIGVQRPDAELFGKGARDNLRHRVSLMRLSREGSLMMWDNPFTGLDLPLKQGRAVANFDGGVPTECQTFWVSEPGQAAGEDAQVLEAFRALAAEKFDGYQYDIDPSKYELIPGELSERARAMISQLDVPLGVTEGEATDADAAGGDVEIPTQSVNVGSLTEGDWVIWDGARAEVKEVDAGDELDDLEGDQITVLLDIDGTEEYLSMDATDRMDREMDLELEGAA